MPLFLLFLYLTLSAHAEDPVPASQSALRIEEVSDSANKVPGDIDTEITNAKIRTDSGSKSRFSLSSVTQYTGNPYPVR